LLATGTFTGESTWKPPWSKKWQKEIQDQRLAKSRPWQGGFFFGSQGSQFSEATLREANQRKPHEFAPAKGGDVARRNSLGSAEPQICYSVISQRK
jgi:hypothetical protein